MRGDLHPSKLALRDARTSAIDRLTAAFVADQLSLEEFEERVDRAYRCRSEGELDALTSDLTAAVVVVDDSPRSIVPARSDPSLETAVAVYDGRREALARGARTIAVLGNTERRGRFHIDGSHAVLSVLGNVELDLRDVELPPGVTTLHVRAVLGNVEITVPPSLIVDCEGTGLLGSFTGVNHMPEERSPDEPVLRIAGSAVLGNVEVRTRPAETSARRLPARGR
ncbi:MAG TPA: DUF1707 domain-containing protein [Polyangiaceae bacterium]|jgi:hypothetical protein|nr:DUF1707 domain-containing protein [Polyangiaceae bacterium]